MIDNLKQLLGNNNMDQITAFESDSSVVKVQDTLSFISEGVAINVNPELIVNNQNHLIGVGLLLLMLLVASIWYFLPNLLVNNFKPITTNIFSRNYDSAGNTSGFIVNTILYLNFLIVSSLLIFMVLSNVISGFFKVNIEWSFFYLIVLGVVLFVLIRYVSIKLSGFIFKTYEMASQQNKLYNSMEKGLGLILLPLLLFSLYSNLDLFLYLAIIIFLLFILSRWIFTIAIGIRVSKFSWFHIILYLCTLEIIPFIFLIKILRDQAFWVL